MLAAWSAWRGWIDAVGPLRAEHVVGALYAYLRTIRVGHASFACRVHGRGDGLTLAGVSLGVPSAEADHPLLLQEHDGEDISCHGPPADTIFLTGSEGVK